MAAAATAPHQDFAARLKSARLRVGKSQEQIAAEVGTSRRHWIRWEGGHNLPSAVFIAKIAEATGQTSAFLNGEPSLSADESTLSEDDDEESDLEATLGRIVARLVHQQVAAQLARERRLVA